ncbi:MAG: RNA polymerase subunit sigma-24 [Flavobacteriaceae bacterium]|nr:MAG: RNA polymerase subunit sigma-24 [Flavobacteriaceae bacterium]
MGKNRDAYFETIYHQHQPMVLQMCLGFVKGDIDIANDLLQEVFISVWNNLEKFKGASTYKTWIYRITVNTCLQYIKKEKKEQTYPILEIESQNAVVNNETVTNPNIQRLYTAIGQLKKIDRLLIMMVLENQDYDSISEIIGIKPTNVRVKIHRIKKRLETILKNTENG